MEYMTLAFYTSFFTLNIIMGDQILASLSFSKVEIIGLSLLFIFFVIQLFFFINYYRISYSYVKKIEKDPLQPSFSRPKVSVIIASENEADELAENLPAILSQDYPDFEVIVINNGSTDETDNLLQSLTLQNPHLYHTYLPYSNDKAFGRQKLALTIGIKAAKGEVLLFTEPYSKPVSNKWISSMMDVMSEQKDVVLGYSFYTRVESFFNRVARFDNHIFSMQYLSMAIKDKPYTGTYRNLAFKKQMFFDNKGFASFLNLENGEDVFINQIVNETNTAIAVSTDSFIETSIARFSLWRKLKKSYSIAKTFYKGSAPVLFNFEAYTRIFFYLVLSLLCVYGAIHQHWVLIGIAVLLFLIRLTTQLIVINKSAEYFRSGKFYFSLILMDIIQPLYNLRFRTRYKRARH